MHILNYLKNAEENLEVDDNSAVRFEYKHEKNSVRVEYRLICSGMVRPAHFLGDWSHSDGARILLMLPVELMVASRPYDDYPQAARVAIRRSAGERGGRQDFLLVAPRPGDRIGLSRPVDTSVPAPCHGFSQGPRAV